MKQMMIFAVFLLASQAVESKNIQINPFQNTRISAKDCKKPGLNCANCQTVLFCIEKGSGEFEYDYEVVNKCDLSAGMSCINGACSGKPNPECATQAQVQFRCPEIGMFPDPYDCRTFHSCCSKGAVSQGNQCEKGYSYDPSSTFCKTKLTEDAPCPPATAISCTTPGQSGVTSNPTIYYVCTNVGDANGNQVLYPKLHVCPNGKNLTWPSHNLPPYLDFKQKCIRTIRCPFQIYKYKSKIFKHRNLHHLNKKIHSQENSAVLKPSSVQILHLISYLGLI